MKHDLSIGNHRYWKPEDVLFIMRFWYKIPIEIKRDERWEISQLMADFLIHELCLFLCIVPPGNISSLLEVLFSMKRLVILKFATTFLSFVISEHQYLHSPQCLQCPVDFKRFSQSHTSSISNSISIKTVFRQHENAKFHRIKYTITSHTINSIIIIIIKTIVHMEN